MERHLAASPDALFEILADHAHYDRFNGIPPLAAGYAGQP